MRKQDHLDQTLAGQYLELKNLASSHLRRLPPGQTLSATALVHEAYIKVAKKCSQEEVSEDRILTLLSYAIRDVLVSYVRSKMRAQRRQAECVILASTMVEVGADSPNSDYILNLDRAIQKLERADSKLAEIVVLHAFGEIELERIASMTGAGYSTVKRRWQTAKMWLRSELGPVDG